jgi:hypothetical protein
MITTVSSPSNRPVAVLFAVASLAMLYFQVGLLVGGLKSGAFQLYSKQVTRNDRPIRYWSTCVAILLFICISLLVLYIAKDKWTGWEQV